MAEVSPATAIEELSAKKMPFRISDMEIVSHDGYMFLRRVSSRPSTAYFVMSGGDIVVKTTGTPLNPMVFDGHIVFQL